MKLERAQEHVETLDRETRAFFEGEPYRVAGKQEAEGTQHVFNVEVVRNPPPAWGPIIGDGLQNMRSALDYLAWQLVRRGGGSPDTKTGFPIFLDDPFAPGKKSRNLLDSFRQKVDGMTRDMIACIKELQPYNSDRFSMDDLWILNELARIDRHQVLHAVGAVSLYSEWIAGEKDDSGSFLDTPLPTSIEPHVWYGPFEDGAEIARFILGKANPKVSVDFKPSFSIAFSDSEASRVAAGDPIVLTLEQAWGHIKTKVVPRFVDFF